MKKLSRNRKKLRINQKQQILKNFSSLDLLLEHETDPYTLGYESYAVSIFKQWLTKEEYFPEMDKVKSPKIKTEIYRNRIKLLSVFYQDSYYYDRDKLFPYDNKESFLRDVSTIIKNEYTYEVIINTNYNVVIELGGDSFTDIFHFCNSTKIKLFKEKVHENNLNIFNYT